MNFLDNKENKSIKDFLKEGYLIGKVENKKSLIYVNNLIKKVSCKLLNIKKINLNKVHKIVKKENLNEFRLSIIKQ